jgi:hypothetical protein
MEGNERGIQPAVKPWMGMHRSWGIALKYAEYQETPNKHVGFKAYSCLCNAKIRDTSKGKVQKHVHLKGGTVRASSSRKDIESNESIVSHTLSSNESCTAASKAFMEDDGRRSSR